MTRHAGDGEMKPYYQDDAVTKPMTFQKTQEVSKNLNETTGYIDELGITRDNHARTLIMEKACLEVDRLRAVEKSLLKSFDAVNDSKIESQNAHAETRGLLLKAREKHTADAGRILALHGEIEDLRLDRDRLKGAM